MTVPIPYGARLRRALLGVLAALLLLPAAAAADTGPYLDATSWPPTAGYDWVRFDADGIPQVQRGSEYVYNPVTISEYGLQEWSFYKDSGDAARLASALRAADWLVAHQQPDSGAWTYDYDFPLGGMDVTLRAPWISAMAQGVAMSLLVRAWSATGDARYLDAAEAALAPFRLSVADGGVTADFTLTGGHMPYYEEYPSDPASFTLNGFMFSLIGLHDLADAAPASDAGGLYADGMRTLEAALPLYDTGGVSAYHLGHLTDGQPVHTSLKYHHIHVVELTYLDSLGADPTLELYRDRWAAYVPPAPPRRPAPPTRPSAPATGVAATPPPTPARPRPPAPPAARKRAWTCSLAGRPIERRGHVACGRARHVLRRKLAGRRIRSPKWRCHGAATVTCRRGAEWVRIRRAPRV